MVKLAFPVLICFAVLLLLRRGRLNLDLSGLLILALVAMMVVSTSDHALYLLADVMSINYVPLAIVAVAIGLLLCIVITLSVMVTDSRNRQNELLRRLAQLELSIGRPPEASGPI